MSGSDSRVPVDVILRWWEEGLTYPQMAERGLKEYGDTRSWHAYHKAVTRRDGDLRRNVDLPWPVRPEHRSHTAYAVVRNYLRREAGLNLSPRLSSQVDSWLRDLDEKGLVIDYDPEKGFGLRERRAGEVLYRRPDES